MNSIYEWVKERKAAIINGLILAVSMVHLILTVLGYLNLVEPIIACIIAAVIAFWCYWKNNSWTISAITGDGIMKALKQGFLLGSELTDKDEEEMEVVE